MTTRLQGECSSTELIGHKFIYSDLTMISYSTASIFSKRVFISICMHPKKKLLILRFPLTTSHRAAYNLLIFATWVRRDLNPQCLLRGTSFTDSDSTTSRCCSPKVGFFKVYRKNPKQLFVSAVPFIYPLVGQEGFEPPMPEATNLQSAEQPLLD